ncbi:MAG TPA: macro domain-containing protein [Candidatus Deferrimicrobiaceae bacterium]|nr:macro domain-containing protein [Candidatus Deferrimicrobiaceae bacterium]
MAAGTWLEVRTGRVLEVTQGDITRVAADAIVNAANEALAPGGGVDGAIHRAGGPAILRDLEARYGRVRRCPTGEAVVTTAGILPARWVIHAVGPIWRGGATGEPGLLAAAYRAAMARAEALGARSVALPAISCGVYGYPLDEGSLVALRTVAGALAEGATVARATFVLYSFDTFEVFRATIERVRGEAPGSAG